MTSPVITDQHHAHRAHWVTTLRGGGYRQGRNALRDVTELGAAVYCCLGVAEDLRGATWQPIERSQQRVESPIDPAGSHCIVSTLPFSGREILEATQLTREGQAWLGLAVGNPYVVVRRAQVPKLHDRSLLNGDEPFVVVTLVDLNDGESLSFAEIADVIDDQPADWDGSQERARQDRTSRNAVATMADAL